MKTKHPIYKAYKDGKLIKEQYDAIGLEIDGIYNVQIDPSRCDDLRLFTGAETSDSEPIYEGDVLYTPDGESYPVRFAQDMLQWRCKGRPLYSVILIEGATHKKPQPERRKGERRTHKKDRRGSVSIMGRRVRDKRDAIYEDRRGLTAKPYGMEFTDRRSK